MKLLLHSIRHSNRIVRRKRETSSYQLSYICSFLTGFMAPVFSYRERNKFPVLFLCVCVCVCTKKAMSISFDVIHQPRLKAHVVGQIFISILFFFFDVYSLNNNNKLLLSSLLSKKPVVVVAVVSDGNEPHI